MAVYNKTNQCQGNVTGRLEGRREAAGRPGDRKDNEKRAVQRGRESRPIIGTSMKSSGEKIAQKIAVDGQKRKRGRKVEKAHGRAIT